MCWRVFGGEVGGARDKDFDVRGLCMEFPDRLHDLVKETCGDRLAK